MSNAIGAIKPEHIIEIVLRRRWFIIIPFCLSMILGIYFALTLPRAYSSSALIQIQPQKVPSGYVRSIVSTSIESRIRTISQQVLSRTNLEKIIRIFKLYSEPGQEKMLIENKVADMQSRISMNMQSSSSFSISFTGKDPERVMKIANTLATYFIDENLKVRESQAIGTSNFLDDQIREMRKRLKEKEEALREYRKKYIGSLPEQLDSNLRVLESLQKQLAEKQKSLADAKKMLIALEKQMSNAQNIQNDVSIITENTMTEFVAEDSSEVDQLKEQLAILKTRYTDRHPDVVRLNRMITDLKTEEIPPESLESEIVLPEIDYQDLQRTQREEVKGQIRILKVDISKILEKIGLYEKRVEDVPKREEELTSIKRDYNNIQSIYSSLVNRKLEADISVNMEKKQKGEQFRILDPARLPTKPVSPNLMYLFMLSTAAGLGVGCGLIFLLEFFNTSFRRLEDIESYLGLSVLATVPMISHPKDKKKQKLNQILSAVSITILFVLFAGFAMLMLKAVD